MDILMKLAKEAREAREEVFGLAAWNTYGQPAEAIDANRVAYDLALLKSINAEREYSYALQHS